MSELAFYIYFADFVAALDVASVMVTILGTAVLTIAGIMYIDGETFDGSKVRKVIKLSLIVSISGALLTAILPSKKTMHLMIGVAAAEAAATSSEGQKIIDNVNAIIDLKLDEMKEALE